MKNIVELKRSKKIGHEETIAQQIRREVGINEIVGENLTRWREEQGISYAATWEKLNVSAFEYRQWEKGVVSPKCYRFLGVVRTLGSKAHFEASMMVNDLLAKANQVRAIARLGRWDRGYKPASDAIGFVNKYAA